MLNKIPCVITKWKLKIMILFSKGKKICHCVKRSLPSNLKKNGCATVGRRKYLHRCGGILAQSFLHNYSILATLEHSELKQPL